MSALAHKREQFVTALGRLTETEATREISRIATGQRVSLETAESIVTVALRVSGTRALHLQRTETAGLPVTWGVAPAPGVHGAAVAEVSARGRKWGELRLFFDLKSTEMESPLRFARFLGQQIARVLEELALMAERERLRRKVEQLKTAIARRKAIHRAKAIVASSHGIPEIEALKLMCGYSRESGRTLYQVAEAFIFGERSKWRAQPIRFPTQTRSAARSVYSR